MVSEPVAGKGHFAAPSAPSRSFPTRVVSAKHLRRQTLPNVTCGLRDHRLERAHPTHRSVPFGTDTDLSTRTNRHPPEAASGAHCNTRGRPGDAPVEVRDLSAQVHIDNESAKDDEVLHAHQHVCAPRTASAERRALRPRARLHSGARRPVPLACAMQRRTPLQTTRRRTPLHTTARPAPGTRVGPLRGAADSRPQARGGSRDRKQVGSGAKSAAGLWRRTLATCTSSILRLSSSGSFQKSCMMSVVGTMKSICRRRGACQRRGHTGPCSACRTCWTSNRAVAGGDPRASQGSALRAHGASRACVGSEGNDCNCARCGGRGGWGVGGA